MRNMQRKKEPKEKGYPCKEYEKELRFRSFPPAVERHVKKIPRGENAGDYRIIFTDKIIGGFKVDILTKTGTTIAEGVKVRKWSETKVKDPENGDTIMLKLSLMYPQSIRVTVFKDGSEKD